jgi:hypothetical protein
MNDSWCAASRHVRIRSSHAVRRRSGDHPARSLELLSHSVLLLGLHRFLRSCLSALVAALSNIAEHHVAVYLTYHLYGCSPLLLIRVHLRPIMLFLELLAFTPAVAQTSPQETHERRLSPCTEDGLQSNDFGCQLLAKVEVTRFPDGLLF